MKRYIALMLALIGAQSSASGLDSFTFKNAPPILTISSSYANNHTATMCLTNRENDLLGSYCTRNITCSGQEGSDTVTITNIGGTSTPLTTSLTTTSAVSANLWPDNCSGNVLSRGQSCTITVEIISGCSGSISTLAVSSGSASTSTITLRGV
jgi:hypothetical protein